MPKLLICHIPGADLRDVSAERCPQLAGMLGAFPRARFRAQPTTDQLATLLTGTWPHQHGLWGPRLKPDWERRRLVERVIDLVPGALTTAAQCLWHVAAGPVPLATMPPRRRRRLEPCRFDIQRARDPLMVLRPVNGLASIFTAVGAWQGHYVYHAGDEQLDRLLAEVGNGEYALEMADVRCLEHVQRWHLRDETRVARCYRAVDAFLAGLHAKCERNGVTLAVLSDHGMESVHEVVDLRRHLRVLGLRADDYEIFLESTKATFWFHDADTALAVREYFSPCSFGRFLSRDELSGYNLHFEDKRYGDAFFCASAGVTFFPHDLHGFVANALTTLSDPQERQRLRAPWPQAEHGYLSENASAIGFLLVARSDLDAPAEWVEPIDVAPSVLHLIDCPVPPTMSGRGIFQPRRPARPARAARAESGTPHRAKSSTPKKRGAARARARAGEPEVV